MELTERQIKKAIIDIVDEMPVRVLGVKQNVYIQDLKGHTIRTLNGLVQPGFQTLDIGMLLDCVAGNSRDYVNNLNELLDELLIVKLHLKGSNI